jgi:hypothetical protein
MFPTRYFSLRYWAGRFWPKTGAAATSRTFAAVVLHTGSSRAELLQSPTPEAALQRASIPRAEITHGH